MAKWNCSLENLVEHPRTDPCHSLNLVIAVQQKLVHQADWEARNPLAARRFLGLLRNYLHPWARPGVSFSFTG